MGQKNQFPAGRKLGRVLVTGAGGFLGAAVVSALRTRGVDVVATDVGSVVCQRSDIMQCEVTNSEQVDLVVRQGEFDTILHCGAVSGPMVMPERPLDIWKINAGGTASVLEAARRHRVGRVIICSTSEVYGELSGSVDEASQLATHTIYGASKVAGEQAMLGYVKEHGVDAVALRLSWIYGPGRQTPTTLEKLARAAHSDHRFELLTPANAYTHYLHITDAVDGLLRAAEAKAPRSKILNITAGPAIEMSDVAEIVMQIQPGIAVTCAPSTQSGRGISELRNQRAFEEIGFAPKISLESGLKQLFQHFLSVK
ncbi:CDP-paratose 2-epimerase (plasmid) [Sulfitobacter sp. DSM 110093]|uniref:NAD-dependent epimerase/dehydratase family protein n=1 Tax=Sulfitobacter sp. DSM 110093 TaxID=2883127 RepID=UPI001FAC5CC2|nr:NAD(P)-dependent oxidoreductase [Sulfitobacter sp. DSM 110093]UOA33781.1 CDP-paratose 2-epimerase [Sulfitobacter sp. DSM 110093]UOA34042.1 CDP-paratose 2-epimerase [Sulfitobacter sp. DSM 110093]